MNQAQEEIIYLLARQEPLKNLFIEDLRKNPPSPAELPRVDDNQIGGTGGIEEEASLDPLEAKIQEELGKFVRGDGEPVPLFGTQKLSKAITAVITSEFDRKKDLKSLKTGVVASNTLRTNVEASLRALIERDKDPSKQAIQDAVAAGFEKSVHDYCTAQGIATKARPPAALLENDQAIEEQEEEPVNSGDRAGNRSVAQPPPAGPLFAQPLLAQPDELTAHRTNFLAKVTALRKMPLDNNSDKQKFLQELREMNDTHFEKSAKERIDLGDDLNIKVGQGARGLYWADSGLEALRSFQDNQLSDAEKAVTNMLESQNQPQAAPPPAADDNDSIEIAEEVLAEQPNLRDEGINAAAARFINANGDLNEKGIEQLRNAVMIVLDHDSFNQENVAKVLRGVIDAKTAQPKVDEQLRQLFARENKPSQEQIDAAVDAGFEMSARDYCSENGITTSQ
ncbi:MAG: hypothetical protein AAFY56_18335 [Pseudomonadota bacterium]